jgi:membrane-bound lytic murein transglycosylase D
MQTTGIFRAPVGVALAAGMVFLASCAITTRPQTTFRTFLLPPQAHPVAAKADDPVPDPPHLQSDLYSTESPVLTTSFPDALPRPSDADFLLKRADDRLAAGRLAYQNGDSKAARAEFNKALEILLAAPENMPERVRVERRLDDMVDAIYRYDVDPSTADPDQVSYDKAPRDEFLEMTFPVDPSLRTKIKEQILATASQLPLEESDAVTGAINYFSSERGKKIIAAGLRRQGRYKQLIERVLAEEGLPQELIFVAQAESGFLPRAMSNKACVGLWQFAKFRGKEYGLDQTPATDDRMDPEKATRAAARHLHDLFDHFGDWYLALAAYDCGPGCIDHAVMRTGYADFWTLRKMNVLPKETANYVPVILAMTIMAKNAKDYGLDNLDAERPVEFDTIELQSPTHIALVADAVERPVAELKELNPALIRSVAPAGYALHVPKGTRPALESAFAVIPANRRDSWRIHRVQDGETMAALAKRFSTPATLLASANHEALPQAGEWAAIPVGYPGDRTPAKHTAAKTTARKKGGTVAAARKAGAKTASKTTSKAAATRAQNTKGRAG